MSRGTFQFEPSSRLQVPGVRLQIVWSEATGLAVIPSVSDTDSSSVVATPVPSVTADEDHATFPEERTLL